MVVVKSLCEQQMACSHVLGRTHCHVQVSLRLKSFIQRKITQNINIQMIAARSSSLISLYEDLPGEPIFFLLLLPVLSGDLLDSFSALPDNCVTDC